MKVFVSAAFILFLLILQKIPQTPIRIDFNQKNPYILFQLNLPFNIVQGAMQAVEGPYQLYNSEDPNSNLIQDMENDQIQPELLSGDQIGEESIYASTLSSQKANFILTVTTIVKTVIGSSILAIPYSMSQLGYAFGTMVFVVAMILTHFGTTLLLKAKNLSRHSNYSTILFKIWESRIAEGLGSLFILLNNLGICIAEMIILKQSIRKVLTSTLQGSPALDQFYTSEEFIVLLVAILETPLTLVSKMEKLKFAGLLGAVNITIFMVSFTIFFISSVGDSDPDNQPAGNMNMFPDDWFLAAAAVPNILLALSYQMNFFPIYKGMRNVTDAKIAKASLFGSLFCTASYLLIGILGYQYVGHNIQANFLESLDYNKLGPSFFFLINLSFIISVYLAFPIMFFAGRNNCIALLKLIVLGSNKPVEPGQRRDGLYQIGSIVGDLNPKTKKKHAKAHFIMYTVLIYLVVIGVAVGVEDIKPVFNIVGAICSTSIAILLPCLFYFKLIEQQEQRKSWIYYTSIVIFCVMGPYAIFSIVALYVHPN